MTSEIIPSFKIITNKQTKQPISNLLLWSGCKTLSSGIAIHNHFAMVAVYLFSFK